MSDDDFLTEDNEVLLPVTNFDRLAAELPEGSVAAKLLEVWRVADQGMRTSGMLSVLQPGITLASEIEDAPTD